MPIPFAFDFKNPDYIKVFEWREENLRRLRQEMLLDPTVLDRIKLFYRNDPAQFIIDWGMTEDPRNVAHGLPADIPFLLFPRQEEWVHWFREHWEASGRIFTVKSRDMGMSELLCGLSATDMLLIDGMNIGMGSRKQDYVDAIGVPDSLMFKVRRFIRNLPPEFRGSWDQKKNSCLLRISVPDTNSILTGEAGDGIGRGARKSYYHVDESAHIPRAHLIEASLSRTTDLRHDLSTPCGPNNPFAVNVLSGRYPVFYFHWSDDPRRDPQWYQEQCELIGDPVIIAQELDHNFNASVEGIIIPYEHALACVDAHINLELTISGIRKGSLDVADEGRDKNAFLSGQGILIDYMEQWSGKNSDIYATTERAVDLAELMQCGHVVYDADGLGAGVRGDSRSVNEKRQAKGFREVEFVSFRGSGEVIDKEKEVWPPKPGTPRGRSIGRKNEDYFGNAKAQAWFTLARKCRNTYRAVVERQEFDPEDIISISSAMPDHLKLVRELSQPTRYQSEDGKLYVDKTPDGMPSPNYGDACMMYFAKTKRRARNFLDVD